MEAVINISGVIGLIDGYSREQCYTFTDLATAVKEARESGATSFRFIIDSDGGLVSEGFLMASYIESLSEPTTSVALRVYSIANVLFFACDKREAETYGTFMLHQALATATGNGTEFREYADQLDRETERIASYIASRTGLDTQALIGLMGTDRYIEKAEAEKLGFLTEVKALKMVALHTSNNKTVMSKVNDALEVIKQALGFSTEKVEPKNLEITLEDGREVFVESEDGEIEGKPTNAPDGTHRLRDGRTITVEGGVVTSVSEDSSNMEGEATPEGEDETQMLRDQVATLQAQIQEMESAKAEAMKEKEEYMNKYESLESEVLAIKKAMTSNAVPLAKHPRYNQAEQNGKPQVKAQKEEKELYGADRLRKKVLGYS